MPKPPINLGTQGERSATYRVPLTFCYGTKPTSSVSFKRSKSQRTRSLQKTCCQTPGAEIYASKVMTQFQRYSIAEDLNNMKRNK